MRFAPGHGFCLIAVLAVGIAACGDDDDGVSGSKRINELSAAERKSFCQELNGKFAPVNDDIQNVICIAEGLSQEAQGGGQTCEATRASCLKVDGEDVFEEQDCSMLGEPDADDATCIATVGEYRKCINALIKQSRSTLSGISCESELGDIQQVMDELEGQEPPSECDVVEAKCPDVMDEMEVGG